MIVLPAIDILGGKSVRLIKGRVESSKVYYDDPLEPALMFKSLGFTHLHLVDLDGAQAGEPKNLTVLNKIAERTGLLIHFGGGLRSFKSVEKAFESGATRVILGTALITNPQLAKEIIARFGSDKVVAAIDMKKGKVAIEGWQKSAAGSLREIIKRVESLQPGYLLLTDVEKDGTLKGVNFKLVEDILSMTNLPVIVSGGVSSLEDLKRAKELEKKGVKGIIIGKAIYEKAIDLKEAVKFNRVD